MTETTSRFKVVPFPVRNPGACAICLSVSRGPFVDTGKDDPWAGTLYLCFGCIGNIANDMGFDLVSKDAEEPVAETDSEAFTRGWHAAVISITEDLSGLADHYRMHATPEPTDPSDFTLVLPALLSEDNGGQEGSGTGADGITIKDSGLIKRQGPNSISSNSGDGESGLRT